METKEDKLDIIFGLQKSFDDEVDRLRGLSPREPGLWIQRETLAMLSEMAELIDEVNFKWWKNPKEISWDNVKNELVDILHFFTSMCLLTGMDANELYERYISKNKENFMRQYGKSQKKGYEVLPNDKKDGEGE